MSVDEKRESVEECEAEEVSGEESEGGFLDSPKWLEKDGEDGFLDTPKWWENDGEDGFLDAPKWWDGCLDSLKLV